MAKSNVPHEEKGRVKFRLVEFELDGSNPQIEQSIKNIVSSITHNSSSSIGRALPSKPAEVRPLQVAEPDPPKQDQDASDLATGQAVATTAPSPAVTRSKGIRHYTSPKFLGDLDLDSGDTSFKAFAERIEPTSHNDRYLTAAAWFQRYRGVESISVDHVYTCYQKMGWQSQKDVGQPFRVLKKTKSYFEHPSKGLWKITHIGLDRVSELENGGRL